MNPNLETDFAYRQVYSRDSYLFLLRTSLEAESFRFARQAAMNWLAIYSGDLEVQFYLCKALAGEGKSDQAINRLEKLIEIDPEYGEIYHLLGQLYAARDQKKSAWAYSLETVLDPEVDPVSTPIGEWGLGLRSARIAMQKGLYEEAERLIYPILGKNLEIALPAVIHVRIVQDRHDSESMAQLARIYHARWPECLQFILCMADAQVHAGDETQAINHLHQAIANDPSGQVPVRMWGNNFRYRPLWPNHQEIGLDIPIPVDVAYRLGWNQLSAGSQSENDVPVNDTPVNQIEAAINQPEKSSILEQELKLASVAAALAMENVESKPLVPNISDTDSSKSTVNPEQSQEGGLSQVERVFEQLANQINQPRINKTDHRFPVYVLFSTHTGLVKQYGQQTALMIEAEMKHLAETVQKRAGWGSMVFLPDEIDHARQVGVKPIETIDPWQLKLSLGDLDHSLAKKGAMIGTLLIVGGPETVPFHRLPNPTDDGDVEIISDNPYATLDSNYFVPEWPVGRLPGEAGTDAGLLLDQIRRLIKYHQQTKPSVGIWQWFLNIFHSFGIKNLGRMVKKARKYASFGYSAAAWRRSSLAVFRPIGSGSAMLISPPEFSGSFDIDKATNSSAAYYNLHGLPDAAEWYGQRDLSDSPNGPDYPVALSPKDLIKNGSSPIVVFSEACYGGLIEKKNESTAMALRFLSIGTMAMVGSTSIAYGSVTTPLIGADLLSYLFWKNQNEGMTVGEAFLQAKIELAREMKKRQGFLDGEDQKTLLSFVLYGDPLVNGNIIHSQPKNGGRLKNHPDVNTSMETEIPTGLPKGVTKEMIIEVKRLVESYLPGLDDADIIIKNQQQNGTEEQKATKEEKIPTSTYNSSRVVVTICKRAEVAQRIHRHYARATLDSQGKIVKLAISR